MRKLSLILLIACLASACIKETPATGSVSGDRGAINFMTATYNPGTKTDPEIYTGGVYNTSETFGVYAFTLDNNNYGIETSREFGYVTSTTNDRYPDLMYNDGVAYNSTSGTWSPILRDYFWPKQNRVAFFAYSPFYPYVTNSGETDYPDYKVANSIDKEAGHDGYGRRAASFNVSTDNNKKNRFYHYLGGVTIANDIPGGKNDLLYSDIALNFNDFADGSDTDIVSNGTVTTFNGVPILFHHAFCKISFKAKLAYVSDEEEIPENNPIIIPNIEEEQPVSFSSTPTDDVFTYEYDGDKAIVTRQQYHTDVTVTSQRTTYTRIWGRNTYSAKICTLKVGSLASKGDLHLRSKPVNKNDRSQVLEWDMSSYTQGGNEKFHSYWKLGNVADASVTNKTVNSTAEVSLITNKIVIPQVKFFLSGSSRINNDFVDNKVVNNLVNIEYDITTTPESRNYDITTTVTTITQQIVTTSVRVYDRYNGFSENDDPTTWMRIADPLYDRDPQDTVISTETEAVPTTVTVDQADSGFNTTLRYKTGDIPLDGLCGIHQWEMGKSYTYVIVISPKAGKRINWDPAKVSDWTAGSATIDL